MWTILLLVSLGWMGRRWTLLLLLFPPVLGELWLGNLNILLGLAIVLGMRWSAAWSFVLLTKITPGVGLVWFAMRREWRCTRDRARARRPRSSRSATSSRRGCGPTSSRPSRTQVGATVDVPRQAAPIPLPLRVAVAALLVAWAARTDRAWVLPIAAGLAVPFLWWNAFAVMVAAVPLYAWRPAAHRTAPAADGAASPLPAHPG